MSVSLGALVYTDEYRTNWRPVWITLSILLSCLHPMIGWAQELPDHRRSGSTLELLRYAPESRLPIVGTLDDDAILVVVSDSAKPGIQGALLIGQTGRIVVEFDKMQRAKHALIDTVHVLLGNRQVFSDSAYGYEDVLTDVGIVWKWGEVTWLTDRHVAPFGRSPRPLVTDLAVDLSLLDRILDELCLVATANDPVVVPGGWGDFRFASLSCTTQALSAVGSSGSFDSLYVGQTGSLSGKVAPLVGCDATDLGDCLDILQDEGLAELENLRVWRNENRPRLDILARKMAGKPAPFRIEKLLGLANDGVFEDGEIADVATDSSGNVFVLVRGWANQIPGETSSGVMAHRVVKLSPDGTAEEILSPYNREHRVRFSTGMAVDRAGNVYVGTRERRVLRISSEGDISEVFGSTGDKLPALTKNIYGLTVDVEGTLYVKGWDGVYEVDAAGNISGGFGPRGFFYGGIATDREGNVYAAKAHDGKVFRLSPTHQVSLVIDESGSGADSLRYAEALATDGSGNVYVTGMFTHNAFRISSRGEVDQIIDVTGDGVSDLFYPKALVVDKKGNVFVGGGDSANVFMIEPDGTITEVIDHVGDGESRLVHLRALALDAQGRILVASVEALFRVDVSQRMSD